MREGVELSAPDQHLWHLAADEPRPGGQDPRRAGGRAHGALRGKDAGKPPRQDPASPEIERPRQRLPQAGERRPLQRGHHPGPSPSRHLSHHPVLAAGWGSVYHLPPGLHQGPGDRHTHKGGAAHYRKYKRLGKRIEVAVALGCDPATTFAATLPLPEGVDELIAAGFLRKAPVELVECETIDMEVPATAEIVLEGYVDPEELRVEGPFGDHTGFYSLPDQFPVFHLTCITHRRSPIYQTIIVGKPVQEDCFMGAAIERLFLPLIKKQLPEVVDFHMPFEGVFHNLMIVAIDKQYPGHARKVMYAIWGTGQAMFTKVIVVVDRDVNVRNLSEVTWKVLNHIDPERDIQFVLGPVETLDHASRLPLYGSKMGVDGTRKWASEGFTRDWPDEIIMDEPTKTLVNKRWREYGLD